MRSGAGLRVVLHAEEIHAAVLQAFRRSVVEVDVRGPGPGWSMDSMSTLKPWFCVVMAIRPVSRSFTGWLPPWWPNLSLYVRPPRASPSICCPRQMPKMGSLPMRSSHRVDHVGDRLRIPGPVRDHQAVRMQGKDLPCLAGAGTTVTRQPGGDEMAQDVVFHAAVHDYHVVLGRWRRIPEGRLRPFVRSLASSLR